MLCLLCGPDLPICQPARPRLIHRPEAHAWPGETKVIDLLAMKMQCRRVALYHF